MGEFAVGQPEFAENREPRCPVILLLDTSGSMNGEPIQKLNEGIVRFKEDLEKDTLATLRVEVAIVTFGPVQMEQDFVTVDRFQPSSLNADNMTPMGEAINYALDLLEDRKQTYKYHGIEYYRPWVMLITDGAPNSDDPWQEAAKRVREGEDKKKHMFFAIGVEGADMDTLKQIAPPKRPPLKLKELKFEELFRWVSNSLGAVSNSGTPGAGGQVELSSVKGWGEVPQ